MYQKSNICNLRTLFHDLLNNLCCTPSLCLIIVRNNYLVPVCTIYYIVCNVHLWPPYPQWPPCSQWPPAFPASGLRDHSITPVILNSRLPNLYNPAGLTLSHSYWHKSITADLICGYFIMLHRRFLLRTVSRVSNIPNRHARATESPDQSQYYGLRSLLSSDVTLISQIKFVKFKIWRRLLRESQHA